MDPATQPHLVTLSVITTPTIDSQPRAGLAPAVRTCIPVHVFPKIHAPQPIG